MRTKFFSILLTAILFGCSLMSFSQKVDMDEFSRPIKLLTFPDNYTPKTERNFLLKRKGMFGFYPTLPNITIDGFKVAGSNPNVLIEVEIQKPAEGTVEYATAMKLDKTKPDEYSAYSTMTYVTSIKIYGHNNALSKEQIEKYKKGLISSSDLVGIYNYSNQEIYSSNFKKEYKHSSSAFASKNDAYNDYNKGIGVAIDKNKSLYIKELHKNITEIVNKLYGYSNKTEYIILEELDTKKHPEFDAYTKAIETLKKTINDTSKLSKNELIGNIKSSIDYFNTVVNKYTSDEKSDKKLRHYTLVNLARIYYLTENIELCKSTINSIKQLDYNKSDLKNIEEDLAMLELNLKFHNLETRIGSFQKKEEIVFNPYTTRPIIANFPLKENGADVSNNKYNTNTQGLKFEQCLISEGNYKDTKMMTDKITTLNPNEFSFSVNALPNLTNGRKPIIVMGHFGRVLGLEINREGYLELLYNNSNLLLTSYKFEPNKWVLLRVDYSKKDSKLLISVNNEVIASFDKIELSNAEKNTEFTLSNYSNGSMFSGKVRDLIIYSNP